MVLVMAKMRLVGTFLVIAIRRRCRPAELKRQKEE